MDENTLQKAFERFVASVEEIRVSGDWARFADLFTEDADYIEHAYGTFKGRDEIRPWIIKTMTSFPGNEMIGFPPEWHVLDLERSRVVCNIRNIMRDPGDGSVHEASNITILTYAGDDLWSCEEDIYNPAKFAAMTKQWSLVAREHGTLSEAGQKMLKALGG